MLADRLWPTLLLVGTSTLLAALIGVWIGVRARLEPGQPVRQVLHRRLADALLDAGVVARADPDRPARGGARAAARPVPDRRAALGRRRPGTLEGVLDTAWHLTLPVITLTLAYLADYALIMRGSLIDELGSRTT